jgi:ferrous iron transport protein B
MIFTVTVVLWLLLNFPRAEPGKAGRCLDRRAHRQWSCRGGQPIGFNRDIALSLIPSMAAREVAVSSLATTYAVGSSDDDDARSRPCDQLKRHWSLATALAFLAWFVFAPQCMSTIAVTRRETNGWKWPACSAIFSRLPIFAGLVYWTAIAFGLG